MFDYEVLLLFLIVNNVYNTDYQTQLAAPILYHVRNPATQRYQAHTFVPTQSHLPTMIIGLTIVVMQMTATARLITNMFPLFQSKGR